MPLTSQEYQKIGQAIASQLQSVLGTSPSDDAKVYAGTPQVKSAEAIGSEYQAELVTLVKDLVGDLKAAGHLPAGKELTEAVIVIA